MWALEMLVYIMILQKFVKFVLGPTTLIGATPAPLDLCLSIV